MFIKLAGLAAVVIAAFRFGALRPNVRWRLAAAAAIIAITLHGAARLLLPHDAIQGLVQRGNQGLRAQLLMILIAMVETAGLWVPVAVIPWASLRSRTWLTLYLVAAAALAAAVYFFPFDVVIVNGEIVGPKHPAYELDLVLVSALGIVAYLFGRARRARQAPAAPA